MHFPKPDTFVIMCAAMSEKMVEQQNTILDLTTHLASHHETMDADQRTISDLRDQLEEVWGLREANERQKRTISDLSYKVEHYDSLRRENERLSAEVRELKLATYKVKYGGQTPEEVANNYMKVEGLQVCNRPRSPDPNVFSGKIDCIKVVREMTGWGLKEAKDFVEAYMARHENQKEETPSGTKRSSQVPAGVGEGVKKSA